MPFKTLGLAEPVVAAVQKEGYSIPTPIQREAIPILLEGKDLLGCAQTGTGKTAAFALPILHKIYESNKLSQEKYTPIECLVLTPTRELAVQVAESFYTYGKNTSLRTVVVYGGVSQKAQTDILRQRHSSILIATPGRLLDLINQRFVDLKNIKYFVLDEADRMLDMGFAPDINRILKMLPKERQSIFFSATLSPTIVKLANSILHHPIKIEITPKAQGEVKIDEFVFLVEKENKKKLLYHLLKTEEMYSLLIFTRTKRGADRVAMELEKTGYQIEVMHGDKSQAARQRSLNNFKKGISKILVATDVAARGIDVDNISHVINYDVTDEPDTYTHRIGRTGRAGEKGIAISFCDREERRHIREIEKFRKKKLDILPTPSDLSAIVIEQLVEPQKKTHHERSEKRSGGGHRSSPYRGNSSRSSSNRSSGNRTEHRSDYRDGNRVESRSDNRSEPRTEVRSEHRSYRSGERSEYRGEPRTENREPRKESGEHTSYNKRKSFATKSSNGSSHDASASGGFKKPQRKFEPRTHREK